MKSFFKYAFLLLGCGLAGLFGGSLHSAFFGAAIPESPLSLASNTSNSPVYSSYTSPPTGGLPANSPDFVAASSLAIPSVVYIKTVAGQEPQNYFDLFFNGGGGGKQVSSGSGVIFSSNGYVVTNNHVIDKAETIEVVHQKRNYSAKIIGTDPNTDLALLKIEGIGLPAARVADSRKVAVGEWVLAIGNPFNLTSTVTAGIISAKGRNISLLSGQFPIESFIQTDAAINPGNSGGALVNTKGELVGINTAIFSRTGSYTGYGFAVPSDIVKKVIEDLIKYGTVQKAFIGADIVEVEGEVAKRLGVSEITGVAVTALQEDGPAASAGLRVDDIILKINNQAITGKGTFEEEMAYYNPGDIISLNIRRGKAAKVLQLKLVNRDGTAELVKKSIYQSKTLGADFEAVSKAEKTKLGITAGIRVAKVYSNGALYRLGLDEGFIITSINRAIPEDPAELERLISNAKGRLLIEGVDKNGSKGYYSFGG